MWLQRMLKDIKQDLWQRILDKENRLMRTFQSHAKDSLKIITMLVAHCILKLLYQIDEMFTWHYLMFCHEKKNMCDTTRRNPLMDWSKPWDGGI